jgi:hypothetical protein
MHDIRGDLHERAKLLQQAIEAAQAQFEELTTKLKREQGSAVEDLKTQLDDVNRLIRVATWQHNVRAAITRAIAAVTEIEDSAIIAAGQWSQSCVIRPALEPSPSWTSVDPCGTRRDVGFQGAKACQQGKLGAYPR